MLTLILRSLGRAARPFLAIAAILTAFQAAVVVAAASVGDFAQLAAAVPDFVRGGLGPGLMSFAGMTTLAYWDPPIRLLVVQFAIYIASEPAADVEGGLVDLILARPVPRHRVIGRSLLLMTALLVVLVAAMGASTWAALWLWAPQGVVWPERRIVLLMMVHLAALAWCFGCMALAAAAMVRRRAAAIGLVSLLSVSLFLIDILAEFSPTFAPYGWLTPFHYFHGSGILRGAADPAIDLAVFGGLGLAATVVAFWQFNRRDL